MSARLDRALIRDDFTVPLRLMVAVIMFIAGLGLLGGWVMGYAALRLNAGLRGQMTVEVPQAADEKAEAPAAQEVLAALRAMPEVRQARRLDGAVVQDLLAPWLGHGDWSGLPLPTLLDVQLRGDTVTAAAVSARLAAAFPAVQVHDHRGWVAEVSRMLGRLALALGGMVALLFTALCGTVIVACRAGLLAQRAIVELLYHMGASDAYIYGQMQRYALRLVGPAGFAGMAGTALAAALGLLLAQAMMPDLPPLAQRDFWFGLAAVMALLPCAGLGFAWVGARLATRRLLLAMP